MSREDIFKQINLERDYQDSKWGGPEHDDEHSIDEWADFIRMRCNELLAQGDKDERQLLLEISALGVAALESLNRKNLYGSKQ